MADATCIARDVGGGGGKSLSKKSASNFPMIYYDRNS